ncbi:MAG: hypothetical protein PF961_14930 [Planctomycetota bacterium]|jgi:hypothetical protein|nr:hypothetical protein [Planctomycetota bacterium]
MNTPLMRSGSILIIAAGLCALLALTATTFLVSMQAETDENEFLLQQTQARVSMVAACSFIMESAPKWGGDASGPSGSLATSMLGPHDMTPWRLPPYAITQQRVFSPMGGDASGNVSASQRPPDEETYDFSVNGRVGFRDRVVADSDPKDRKPVFPRKDPTRYVDASRLATGDDRRIAQVEARAWFRVYHQGGGTFVVTVGAGGTPMLFP